MMLTVSVLNAAYWYYAPRPMLLAATLTPSLTQKGPNNTLRRRKFLALSATFAEVVDEEVQISAASLDDGPDITTVLE